MITPSPSTVGQLLGLQTRFVVPSFQRPYAWTSSEVEEFLDDLEVEGKAGRGLFLGSVLLDISFEPDGKILVVDGQQRLTSIFLLLIACRDRAYQLGSGDSAESQRAKEIGYETQRKIGFIDPVSAEPLGPRMVASETIRDVFTAIANSSFGGVVPDTVDGKTVRRQAKKVRAVFQHFWERLQGMDLEKLKSCLKAIYATRVIRIDIDSDEEAFSLFERTNARGADLEISDLLKSFLFQQKVPDIEEKWKVVLANADSTVTKMLKYFYVSKRGYVTKSILYRSLKALGKSDGAAQFLSELTEFSRFYAVVRNEENEAVLKSYLESMQADSLSKYQDRYGQVHLSFQAFRLFRVSQVYPLIYSALCCFLKQGGAKDDPQAKHFVRLIEDLENYHFVNNAVCDRVGNEVEKLYADYCEKFAKATNFVDMAKEVQRELRERLAGKSEFVTRFCDMTYSQENIGLICYVFDRMNNLNRKPGERVVLYSPNNTRANHNVEHFLPRSLKFDEKGNEIEDMEFVDNIGNLLVISFHVNSKLGNGSPAEKVAKLEGALKGKVENMEYVSKFLVTYSSKADKWGRETVVERAKSMASEAYDKVWVLN